MDSPLKKGNKVKAAIASTVVRCACCGKDIPPNAIGIATEYVWRDGVNLCFECNKKAAKK